MGNRKFASLMVSLSTKDALDEIKHEGQSYGGIIKELIHFWKEKKTGHWAPRKEPRSARAR